MSSNYPGTLDSFTNPAPTDYEDVVSHSGQHSNANDAIENIEAVLGTTAGSALFAGYGTADKPVKANSSGTLTQALGLGTLTSGTVSITSVINDSTMATASATNLSTSEAIKAYSDSGTQTQTNKTLTSPKINENVALTATSTELNTLDGSVPRKSAIFGSSILATIAGGETKYISFGISNSAYDPSFVVPFAGTVKNLYVYTGGAPGLGKNNVFTMMKNNSAQTLTTTISGDGSNSGNDTTHSFSVAAGDRLSLRAVFDSGSAKNPVNFCVELDMN